MSEKPGETGFVRVHGYRLFYRTFGPPTHPRVLLGLHGGPGASHDYLRPLGDLEELGFRVVLFDQLGCGNSDVPEDHSLFTLEHHLREVEAVRSELGLGRVHLLGSSYGGLLALAYAIHHPDHLRSLTTVGGLASVPFAQREMNRLREELPAATLATLQRFEARGEFHAPEYLAAVQSFYRRHICRLPVWPPELVRTFEMVEQRPVYAQMNGPNEFTITGSIRDIDLAGQLSRIHLPTLVLGGRFDEVTPLVARQIHDGIPGSRSYTFEQSSHLPFWEERELFMVKLAEFLGSVEGPAAA